MAGFLIWVGLMAVALVVLVIMVRRADSAEKNLRRQSDSALLQIREVAAKRHIKKFGRPPTATGDWKEEAKK